MKGITTMPNWTNNRLVISHEDASKIALIKEGALNNHLFNSLIPMPEEIKSTEDGWYEWSIQNWGTKWDACEASVIEESDCGHVLCLGFLTAWAFPLQFLEELGKQGYTVRHYFADENWEDFGHNFFHPVEKCLVRWKLPKVDFFTPKGVSEIIGFLGSQKVIGTLTLKFFIEMGLDDHLQYTYELKDEKELELEQN